MELRSFFTVLLALSIPLFSFGQNITVAGSWTPTISPPTEAGNNYSSTPIVSNPNQTTISISSFLLLSSYTVTVHKSDGGNWHNDLVLEVQRTGNGTWLNIGTLSGPLNVYQLVKNTPDPFFYYASLLNLTSINNIPVQYRLSGLSVLLPAKNYSTTVIYTISKD